MIMAYLRTRSGKYVGEIISVSGIVCSRKALSYKSSFFVDSSLAVLAVHCETSLDRIN